MPKKSPVLWWLGIVLYTLALLRFVASNCFYFGDDYDRIWQASTLSLPTMMNTPIDVHYAPLMQALCYLLTHIAPLNFPFAIGVLAAIHLLTILLLYRLLQEISPGPINRVLIFMYGTQAFLLFTFYWLEAGLHRLPYILGAVSSLYFYMRLRQTGKWYHSLFVICSLLMALGFYEKAVLIPVYILGLEAVLTYREGGANWLKNIQYGVMLLLGSLIYVTWYYTTAPVMHIGGHGNIFTALEIIAANFQFLFDGLLLNPSGNIPLTIDLIPIFLFAIWLYRKNYNLILLSGIALFALLTLNFSSMAIQAREQVYGALIATAPRYYFELQFLIIIFLRFMLLPIKYSSPSGASITAYTERLLLAGAGIYAVFSLISAEHLFWEHENQAVVPSAKYMHHLMSDLNSLPRKEINLPETDLPSISYGAFGGRMALKNIIPLRFKYIKFVEPDKADYFIKADGSLQRKHNGPG